MVKIIIVALAIGWLLGHVSIDVLPSMGTYGVSVGTDTHYCSVESSGVSCEVAN